MAYVKSWKIYGAAGHRQRESFGESYVYDFSSDKEGTRIIKVDNHDVTGTNEYSLVTITRDSEDECDKELNGQLWDGIFENSRVGKVINVPTKITKEQSRALLSTGEVDGNYTPYGCFYEEYEGKFIAYANEDGNCWVEEFDSLEECIRYYLWQVERMTDCKDYKSNDVCKIEEKPCDGKGNCFFFSETEKSRIRNSMEYQLGRAEAIVTVMDFIKYECYSDDYVAKVLDYLEQLKELTC